MDRLLNSPEETAALLGIGRTRVFALLAAGEIESVRVGRRRLIPTAAVEDFVARLREHADPRPAA